MQHAIGPHKDAPNKILIEGNQINLNLTNNGSTGHICWNLPTNYDDISWPPEEYNGILLLLDTKPINITPQNGSYYEADPTADRNIHVGDKIEDCLVIGAFYNDLTTELTITGLQEKTPYYIAAFAVDNVCRYSYGIYSYSLPLELNKHSDDKPGYQIVKLGVLDSDITGLTETSLLKIYIDDKEYTLNIDPKETYEELVIELNNKLASLNSFVSNTPPNQKAYQVTDNLYQFDGYKLNQLECTFSDNPPSISNGTYWIHDGLNIWQDKWIKLDYYNYHKSTFDCKDIWFDYKNVYTWDSYNWKKQKTHIKDDPSINKKFKCDAVWYNGTNFYKYQEGKCSAKWEELDVFNSDVDPTTYLNGYYWYNEYLYQLIDKVWTKLNVIISEEPMDSPWYNPITNKLYQNKITELNVNVINFKYDVLKPDNWYWFSDVLHKWDSFNNQWVIVNNLIENSIDPSKSNIKTGEYWYNNGIFLWDGSQWVEEKNVVYHKTQPIGYRFDGTNYYNEDIKIDPLTFSYDPSILNSGQYWFDTKNKSLFVWNGLNWVSLLYQNNVLPMNGENWYNGKMHQWNGKWDEIKPLAYVELDKDLKFISSTIGSKSKLVILDNNLFSRTHPVGQIQRPVNGSDGLSEVPTYKQMDVGTDGSQDERRNLINNILMQLGYPAVQVELSKEQLNLCVDLALGSLRKLSSIGYERAFYFMNLVPNQQHYYMTDKTIGLNKIIEIHQVHRRSSAWMSSSYGNGIYAQTLMQWLYQPNSKMDLVSYHLVSEYMETLEMMFATRIVHRFNERTRRLDILQNVGMDEQVVVDCVIERTEQELMMDRYCSKWINHWALAEACVMLAQIRGKYSSVPGAGGSVSLNAGDMQSRADELFEKCRFEVDNYIVNNPEKIGLECGILLG